MSGLEVLVLKVSEKLLKSLAFNYLSTFYFILSTHSSTPERRFKRKMNKAVMAGVILCSAVVCAAPLPGRRGVVIDERLSAVRAAPDMKSRLVQRPGRGRIVGILGLPVARGGARFYRVAISRNRRGWILADAVVRSGSAADGERLLRLIEEKPDEYSRVVLARLCADEFSRTPVAPKCLIRLGEAAERAADRLSRDAARRYPVDGLPEDERRKLVLNFTGLDRYNRLRINFDYEGGKLVYDGAAYRELKRRYPGSAEASRPLTF